MKDKIDFKDKFVGFFKRNSTMKIISILVAILVWFFVLSDNNPIKEETIYVSYQIDSQSILANNNEYTIKNVNEISGPVTIRISGRTKSVSTTTQNDFTVSLDFSKVKDPGINTIPIVVETNRVGINIETYSPKTVDVNFEKIVDKSYRVLIDVDNAAIRPGYQLLEAAAVPEFIPMRNFNSAINNVATVRVNIGPEDVGEPIGNYKVVRKICKYYDQNGKEITALDNNEYVDVAIRVGKRVPINYNIVGEPNRDYFLSSSSINPTSALIYGEPAILDDITELNTKDVSITNITEDFTEKVTINLPQGVNFYGGVVEPEISVDIQRYASRTINFSSTDIVLNGANEDLYVYAITNNSYSLVIDGKEEDVEQVDIQSLQPRIDVSSLGPGTYNLDVLLNLPGNVRAVNDDFAATVNISLRPTQEPTATPSKEPTVGPTSSPTPVDEPVNNEREDVMGN